MDCLRLEGGGKPKGALAEAIDRAVGGFASVIEQCPQAAAGNVGPVWTCATARA